jgi:hypothetical protein
MRKKIYATNVDLLMVLMHTRVRYIFMLLLQKGTRYLEAAIVVRIHSGHGPVPSDENFMPRRLLTPGVSPAAIQEIHHLICYQRILFFQPFFANI